MKDEITSADDGAAKEPITLIPPPPSLPAPIRRGRRIFVIALVVILSLVASWLGIRFAVRQYINSGPTVEESTAALHNDDADTLRAAFRRHPGMATVKSKTTGDTGLHLAARLGKPKAAGALLDYGARLDVPNDAGFTPVELAIRYDRAAVVDVFLDHGLKLDATFNEKLTPLTYAAANGRPAVVKLLLEHGAKANQGDARAGETPLQQAVFWHVFMRNRNLLTEKWQKEMVRQMEQAEDYTFPDEESYAAVVTALLQAGAAVDSRDKEGETPLDYAVENNCPLIVKALVAGGADVNAPDAAGRRPLAIARAAGHQEVVKFLRAHGAR